MNDNLAQDLITENPENNNSFFQTHFPSTLCRAIEGAGYTSPTPIQEKAIPVIMTGKDVIGLAQTGTGKTAAFVLPILKSLASQPAPENGKVVVTHLILAPTRELAEQINENIKILSKGTKVKSATIYGGDSYERQIRNLRAGVQIIVACPGRLLDHMEQKTVDLRHVNTLVLDEADRMFDMGFLPDLRRILKFVPKDRQTILFSATMPEEIEGLAKDILKSPETIQINAGAPTSTVAHSIYPVKDNVKTSLLAHILKNLDGDSVIVFCRTKHGAKRLARDMQNEGHSTTCLQGNLSPFKRKQALAGFREGKYKVMVATDIAARGIDISTISHVINFDMPDCVDTYTHRIGRTGRAQKTGDAYTFVTTRDEWLVRKIEKRLGKSIQKTIVEGFDYKAAYQSQKDDFSDSEDREERRGRGRGRFSDRRGDDRGEGRRERGGFRGGFRSEGRSERPRFGDRRRRKFDDDAPMTEKSEETSFSEKREEGSFEEKRERSSFGDRRERKPFGERRERKSFGERRFGGERRGGRSFGEKREERSFDRSDRSERRPNRFGSEKRSFGDRPRRFDDKPRKFDEQPKELSHASELGQANPDAPRIGRFGGERRDSAREGGREGGFERKRSFGGRPKRFGGDRGGERRGGGFGRFRSGGNKSRGPRSFSDRE